MQNDWLHLVDAATMHGFGSFCQKFEDIRDGVAVNEWLTTHFVSANGMMAQQGQIVARIVTKKAASEEAAEGV